MVEKNNQWLLKKKMGQRYTRWSLRRLSIGVVSVAVSSGVFLFSNMMLDPVAHAAITDTPTIATPASASELPHQQRRPRTQVLPPPPNLAHVNDG
ncbi:YSIRK-type signal peptide-containing protein [Limosilactobacillus fermentum]|uniref:YSIRK-type signal peptide-containing protein n=1 Tax=Limosilactobacillus fermentum TaxID=1613 RepID=UPI0021BDF688|nr:YSIRK-type signal peptide-containing protein [Limosilactobacillus fermentum]